MTHFISTTVTTHAIRNCNLHYTEECVNTVGSGNRGDKFKNGKIPLHKYGDRMGPPHVPRVVYVWKISTINQIETNLRQRNERDRLERR